MHLGTPTFGGPLGTQGGLVFIGATLDRYLRAFDARTGAELWAGRLPAAGIAAPMSYEWKGRQYVVVAASGHGDAGAAANDAIVVFALPKAAEAGSSLRSRLLDHPGGRIEMRALSALPVVALAAWLPLLARRAKNAEQHACSCACETQRLQR
jgi:quinoprotein glucose dehydrogenase